MTVMLLFSMTVFVRPSTAQQTAGWLDAGGATLKQPNSVDRSAWTFGLGLVHQRGPWSFLGQGAVTVANDSVAATQAALRVSLAPAKLSWSLTDVEVSTTTIGIVLPGNDGNQSASARQYVRLGGVQMFAGGGVGSTSRYHLESTSAALQLGATSVWRAFTGTAAFQRAKTDDWQLMEASGIYLRAAAPAYQLNDATVELSWRVPRVTIIASQSWRAGFGNTRGMAEPHVRQVESFPRCMLEEPERCRFRGSDSVDERSGKEISLYGHDARWNFWRLRGRSECIGSCSVSTSVL